MSGTPRQIAEGNGEVHGLTWIRVRIVHGLGHRQVGLGRSHRNTVRVVCRIRVKLVAVRYRGDVRDGVGGKGASLDGDRGRGPNSQSSDGPQEIGLVEDTLA